MRTIIKVKMSLSEHGWSESIEHLSELEDNTDTSGSFSYKIGNLNLIVESDKLLFIDEATPISHKLFSFKTFCYDTDLEQALDLLEEKILVEVARIRDEINAINTIATQKGL